MKISTVFLLLKIPSKVHFVEVLNATVTGTDFLSAHNIKRNSNATCTHTSIYDEEWQEDGSKGNKLMKTHEN
jgi:hypothetical protein